MSRHDINHLPVVDEEGLLQDFVLRKNLGAEEDLRASAEKRLESVDGISGRFDHRGDFPTRQAGTGGLVLCSRGRERLPAS